MGDGEVVLVNAMETADGQTRRRLATRERLYEAAVALITECGYEATTVDEIAARAGVSRRTSFNHFATKGDITVEWARRRRAQAATAARGAADRADAADVLGRLRAYFHELAVITESRPVETREMLFGYLQVCGPVLQPSPMAQELQAWLVEGRGIDASPRLQLSAEILYDVYMGALWRWMRQLDPPRGAFTAELDATVEVVIRGIAAAA